MRKNRGQKIIKTLEIIAIIILIISFFVLAYCIYISITEEKNYSKSYDAQKASVEYREDEEKDISAIIEQANKAVVGISKLKNKGQTIFLENGVSNLGLGTGFIITEDGYIVTNQHVSGEKNETCYVTLEDGRTFTAKVIWSDENLDLSIVKINTTKLKFLELSNSDDVKLAQKVYAIGNPIGMEFQRTVTAGIISGLERTIKLEEENKTSYMEDLIQTDATINPGNSGGPLINEKGQVIAVNTVKITTAEGIGFSVPINVIKPIIEKLKENGEYIGATLGIYAYDRKMIPYINSELNKNYNLDNGIYVAEVIRNSPADKAQIKSGDIIISIDEKEINKMSELRRIIYEKNVGDIIHVKYMRNGKLSQKEITLAKKY